MSRELEPAKKDAGDKSGRADRGGGPPPRAWGQGKKLGTHSQKKGRPLEGSKQGCDVVRFIFLKDHSAWWEDRSERRETPEEASSVAQVSWAEVTGLDQHGDRAATEEGAEPGCILREVIRDVLTCCRVGYGT